MALRGAALEQERTLVRPVHRGPRPAARAAGHIDPDDHPEAAGDDQGQDPAPVRRGSANPGRGTA